MTIEEARAALYTEEAQEKIYEDIRLQADIAISHYSAYQHIYPHLQATNDKLIPRYLEKYRPPLHTDENFDVVKMFIHLYCRNYLPYAIQEALRRYRVEVSHFYGRDEDYEERQKMYYNPETRVFGENMERIAAQLTREFKKGYIHSASDTALFASLSNGNTIEQIAALVYPDSKFTKAVEDKVRYRVNLMHFRLACYALSQGWGYGEQFGLKMIKLYPKQFKQFFGDTKSFPTKEQLLLAAHGDKNWTPPVREPTTPVPSRVVRYSREDFNGKKHKTNAVAYYADGSAYDFVNKVRRVSS